MSTFVLLHGAFRGGWAWGRVRPMLGAAGHEVFTPTLAEDADGLAVWVEQVVGLLEAEDLRDVVLVGHSQAGIVVHEVARVAADRVGSVVYLDAAVPRPGERAVDIAPTPPPETMLPPRSAMIQPRPLEPSADLDASTAAWMNEQLSPTPFAPSLDRAGDAPNVPSTYAFFAGTPSTYPCGTTRARLDADSTPYVVLDGGHDAPLTHPATVAELLLGLEGKTHVG